MTRINKLHIMDDNLKQARIEIASAKKDNSNTERVLAEVIRMSKIKRGLYTGEMVDEIPKNLGMSLPLYRKTIHDLRKSGLIIKVGLTTYLNPDIKI